MGISEGGMSSVNIVYGYQLKVFDYILYFNIPYDEKTTLYTTIFPLAFKFGQDNYEYGGIVFMGLMIIYLYITTF